MQRREGGQGRGESESKGRDAEKGRGG